MAVADITDVTWDIGSYDGAYFVLNKDQLDPKTLILQVNAVGIEPHTVSASVTITDPTGQQFFRNDFNGAWRWDFYIYIMGAYHISCVFNDGTDTREFTYDINTVTQYNNGLATLAIPTRYGQPLPPWEWLPAAGYYNRGDGVCVAGTSPSPVNSSFHCDIITRQCRPIYMGSPMACPPVNTGRINTPNRIIPANLLAHKELRTQSTCWCWAVKPKFGNWEGYTSLNRDIELPEYTDALGNVVPAITYLSSSGIQPTAIPVRLSLAKNATDVTVLAFDREKLEAQFYSGAEFEVFEINYQGDLSERWVAGAGKLGNTNLSDSTAQIELTPWADLANRPLGREVSLLCDVGVMVNEEFGTGRCRNQVLLDGPEKDNWTWETQLYSTTPDRLYIGEITGVTHTNNVFRDVTQVSKGGADIPADWFRHLRNGKVLFTSGVNTGVERDIKIAYGTPSVDGWFGVFIVLRMPLPFTPAQHDTIEVTAGCLRTFTDCQYFNNTANYRGFNNVPGKEGVIRRYQEN